MYKNKFNQELYVFMKKQIRLFSVATSFCDENKYYKMTLNSQKYILHSKNIYYIALY